MDKNKEYCFVLMPFNDKMDTIYHSFIKPTIEELGLACVRADEDVTPKNIVKGIIEAIYNAKIIIADLSEKNANVFYELGISHSFGNNSLIIAEKGLKLPFDIQSYQVLFYEDSLAGSGKFKAELKKRVNSIDAWSSEPNNPVQDFSPAKKIEMVTKAELDIAQNSIDDLRKQVEKSKKQLSKFEKDKMEIIKLRDENKELGTMKELFMRLFHNAFPAGGQGRVDIIEVAKKIFEELEKKGEFSLDVTPDKKTKTNESQGKIIFKRIEN